MISQTAEISTAQNIIILACASIQQYFDIHMYSSSILPWSVLLPYSPENKSLPSLSSKFLHRYFYLIYKPPTPTLQKLDNL